MSTSHDERIMTALAKKQSNGKVQSNDKRQREILLTPPYLAKTFRAHECAMVTAGESRYWRYQDQLVCVHALNCLDKDPLADVSSLIFVDPSALAHASCIKVQSV